MREENEVIDDLGIRMGVQRKYFTHTRQFKIAIDSLTWLFLGGGNLRYIDWFREGDCIYSASMGCEGT